MPGEHRWAGANAQLFRFIMEWGDVWWVFLNSMHLWCESEHRLSFEKKVKLLSWLWCRWLFHQKFNVSHNSRTMWSRTLKFTIDAFSTNLRGVIDVFWILGLVLFFYHNHKIFWKLFTFRSRLLTFEPFHRCIHGVTVIILGRTVLLLLRSFPIAPQSHCTFCKMTIMTFYSIHAFQVCIRALGTIQTTDF